MRLRSVTASARMLASTTSSHMPIARKMWVVMCWACPASGAMGPYARAAFMASGAWVGSSKEWIV